MSVTMVYQNVIYMPVKILSLGKKRYIELLCITKKSHLSRNEIDKIIYHQYIKNNLRRFQQLF